MIANIRHTGITVQDLDKCLSFFVDTLGFKILKELEESGPYIDSILRLDKADVRTIKLAAPEGGVIELLKFKTHQIPDEKSWNGKIYSTGLTHIALTVRDIDVTYNTLLKSGYEFNAPPTSSPDGYARVTFFRGPENIFIELVEVNEKVDCV